VHKKYIIEVDISNFNTLKSKAIEQYKSQISIISERQNKPILSQEIIKRHIGNKEPFYVK